MDLFAGAATVDITPDRPQWLDGFGARTAPSEGAYQSITVKGLALGCGDASALVLSAEVLAFDRARVGRLKSRISQATGVPAEAVILAATHTHCAPRVCDMVMPGEVDPEYVAWFEDRCAEAAARARDALVPVRASWSRTEDRLGVNRRLLVEGRIVSRPNPDGPRDPDVDTLWLESVGGEEIVASVTIPACHPTCRGGQEIGGDYPGFLWRELERATGGVAIVLLGCAGDVRPDFRGVDGAFRMAVADEVAAAGKDLAARAADAGRGRKGVACERLSVGRRVVEMTLEAPPGREKLRRIAADDEAPLLRKWARRMLDGYDSLPSAVPFEVQVLALWPGLCLVCWPGEVAADYALWLKREARSAHGGGTDRARVLTAAYCNGAVGYVPSEIMIPLGGYEVSGSCPYYGLPAPYAPEVDRRLRVITQNLMREVPDGLPPGTVY